MPRLTLDDRTFEDTDGTWTTIDLRYGDPWGNGAEADIWVTIKQFSRKDGGGFDFSGPPDSGMCFCLHEMEAVMLHGFLGAAATLMPRQWAEYQAQEAAEKARPRDKAA